MASPKTARTAGLVGATCILLHLVAAHPSSGRDDSTPCLQPEIERADRDLDHRYRYETNGASGIRNRGGSDSNESILLPGSRDLVVVWHGFMASPPEMRPLGEHLHRSLGATVYIPLIPGFGGGHRVADELSLTHWQRSVSAVIERSARCHPRIALVGYSVGAGLVADYLLSHDSRPRLAEISSLVLLSPYVETAGWMLPLLHGRPRAGFLHLLRSGLRIRRIPLRTILRMSRGRYRDVATLLEEPETYDQSFSLRAGINMLHLARHLDRLPRDAVFEAPTLLAVTEADRTASWKRSIRFAERRFPRLQETIRYPRAESIAHQVVVPRVNPRFGELADSIAAFLARGFERAE